MNMTKQNKKGGYNAIKYTKDIGYKKILATINIIRDCEAQQEATIIPSLRNRGKNQ